MGRTDDEDFRAFMAGRSPALLRTAKVTVDGLVLVEAADLGRLPGGPL